MHHAQTPRTGASRALPPPLVFSPPFSPPGVNYYFTQRSKAETCGAEPREADVSILRDTHVQAVDGFIIDYSAEREEYPFCAW